MWKCNCKLVLNSSYLSLCVISVSLFILYSLIKKQYTCSFYLSIPLFFSFSNSATYPVISPFCPPSHYPLSPLSPSPFSSSSLMPIHPPFHSQRCGSSHCTKSHLITRGKRERNRSMRNLQDIIITLLRPAAGFQISVWMEKVRNTPRTLDPGSRHVCGPTGCQGSCQVLVSCFMNVAIHAFLTQVVWFVDLRFSAKDTKVLSLC